MKNNPIYRLHEEIASIGYLTNDLEVVQKCEARLLGLLGYLREDDDLTTTIMLDYQFLKEKERRLK